MSEAKQQPQAAAPRAAEDEKAARLVPQITVDRMKQSEHNTAKFDVTVQSGVEPDDILPVAYWSHLAATFQAAKLQGNVELTVTAEDLKWQGELIVVDAGVNWARVVFKTTEDGKRFITKLGGLQAHKIVFLPGHTVNYGGIFSKWRIVRDVDGKVLSDKHNAEGDAYSWLSSYAKSIAA